MIGQHIKHQVIRKSEEFQLRRMMALPARYEHDCDQCIYLGQSDQYDLYIHADFQQETVIARFDNEGRDYKSGIYSVGVDHDLTNAFKMAQLRNLI